MRLTTPKTPAPGGGVEPAVRYDFLSSDEFRGMGGSLFPAATPPTVNNGLVLDGATQYATVENNRLTPAFLAGIPDELSLYLEFQPAFNWNDAAARFFWDSNAAAGYRFFVYKVANPDNRIYGNIGSAACIQIDPAVYSASWQQNQRNRIVMAAKSGATLFYMNGAALANAGGATAFIKRLPYDVLLGCGTGLAGFFAGTFYDFAIYPRQLTSAEAIQMTTVT